MAAYEAAIAAFDAGDRETLREFLASDLYEAFLQAIIAQEARQQASETAFSKN